MKKQRVFELTDYALKNLFESKCDVCSKADKQKSCKNVGLYLYSKGYRNSNVFPICSLCQRIRHGLNKSQLVSLALHTAMCSPLVERLNPSKPKNIPLPHPCVRSHSTNYNTYRCSARKRCLVAKGTRCPSSTFTLTRKQFEIVRKSTCYYCGLSESNGVDRLYPTLGYTTSNSVPCCKTCNYAKNDLHPDIYIGHLLRILQENVY